MLDKFWPVYSCFHFVFPLFQLEDQNQQNRCQRKITKYQVLCVWRITVTPGRKAHLEIHTLTIRSPSSWIRVLDGNTCGGMELAKFGEKDPIPHSGINSTKNVMTIVYSSAFSPTRETFNASFSEDGSTSSTVTRGPSFEIDYRDEYNTSLGTIFQLDIPYTLLGGILLCALLISFGQTE
ncbi:unnamed protein product [Dicrocoelium dendriticum]|nr:unnamed protein product [Dicrocoelium dendriticum]